MKKKLEKEISKFVTPLIKTVFAITIVIGIVVGFGIHFFLPRPVYEFSLNGNEVVQLKEASEYIEEGITVIVDGEKLTNEKIVINGEVKDEIGVYEIRYTVKDVKGLENLVLKRVVIIVGGDVIGEPTEQSALINNYRGDTYVG